MRRGLFLVPLLLAGSAFAQGANDAGKALYDKNCAQCHGDTGDGKGPAASRLLPRPRDFTTGKFKIRTTPNGALPTDDDLKNIIRKGMPYTSMPGWPQFTDAEMSQLVAYLKSFHSGFGDAGRAPKAVELPAPPAISAESAEQGAKIYASLGCANCHGETGRGDGPSAPTLKDDLGHPIRAANLAEPWTFRGGSERTDLFRTLSTGLNGTPMPSFQDALKPEERWQLTDFIASLAPGGVPNYNSLVVATAVDDAIDVSKTATSLFEKAGASRVPLVGQIMEPGRQFHPPVTSVVVRAIYDQDKIAFLVTWDDPRADTTGKNAPDLQVPQTEEDVTEPTAATPAEGGDVWGEAAAPEPAPAAAAEDVWGEAAAPAGGAALAPAGSEFSDAVAIQLPVSIPPGATKPYFIFGDGSNPVDLWFLDLAGAGNRVRQLVGRGSTAITALEASEVEGHASYSKGTWSAVFVRTLRSTTGVSFTEDQFVPIAFTVWEGTARERGNRRALTQWAYVYLPPRERPSALMPMAMAGAAVLILELLVVFALRRRKKRMEVVAV